MKRVRADRLLAKFRRWLDVVCELAPGTCAGYADNVSEVLRVLGQRLRRPVLPEDLTRRRLQTHLRDLRARYMPRSLVRICCALRKFARYLYEEEYLPEDVGRFIRGPKVPKRVKRFLDPPTMEALIVTAGDVVSARRTPGDWYALRDVAIVLVGLEAGLRASEVGAVKLVDITWDWPAPGRAVLYVRGKGDKERLVIIQRAVAPLRQYLAVRAQKLRRRGGTIITQDAVFITGDKGKGRPVSRSCVYKVVRKAGARLPEAIQVRLTVPRVHPHLLRRTFATLSRHNGAKIEVLSELMGHDSIDTTLLYAAMDFREAMEANDRHPLNCPGGPPPTTDKRIEGMEVRMVEMAEMLRRCLTGIEALQGVLGAGAPGPLILACGSDAAPTKRGTLAA